MVIMVSKLGTIKTCVALRNLKYGEEEEEELNRRMRLQEEEDGL